MTHFLIALAVFTVFHVIPSTPVRPWAIARFGRPVFMAVFSGLSLILLAWVWLAYRAVPLAVPYWVTVELVRWISATVMYVAVLLAVAALTRPRPVLLTAENVLREAPFLGDVLRITRHPFLWAMGLWGIVHMLNNGDLPSLVLFGYATALALLGTWPIDRRRKRLLPQDALRRLEERTSNVPFLAILQGRNRLWPALKEIGFKRALFAAIIWLLILQNHEMLFGMPVVP